MPLKLIPEKTNFKFISKRYFALVFTLAIIFGTGALLSTKGLNYGIDFTGGVLVEVETKAAPNLPEMRKILGEGASLQNIGSSNAVLIRLPAKGEENQSKVADGIKNKLTAKYGDDIKIRKQEYVGPQVGDELIKTAVYALIAAFGAMMVYIWFRFEWQYGLGGILALVHDAIATIGFYALTGLEFDLTCVAAVLTVIGYSINDSVVIYDRMRENLRKYRKMSMGDLIDLTVNETLSRTIITSGTTFLATAALCIFGGPVLQSFSWGMLFGIIIGTYSSIYVSAIVLLYIQPRREAEAK